MIISNQTEWIDIEQVGLMFRDVYGSIPSIGTLNLWIQSGLINPVKGADIPEWQGSHRANLFDKATIQSLTLHYKRLDASLTLRQAWQYANEISSNRRSLMTISNLVERGVIKSEPNLFDRRRNIRIQKYDLREAIRQLDKYMLSPEQRRERFNELFGILTKRMTRKAIADYCGVTAPLITRYSAEGSIPPPKIIQKMIELEKSL